MEDSLGGGEKDLILNDIPMLQKTHVQGGKRRISAIPIRVAEPKERLRKKSQCHSQEGEAEGLWMRGKKKDKLTKIAIDVC